ncbi:MAG: ATP-binding protein [Patescibacteria group bacterium]|jgi:PAS domain S-box-containing protein
MLKPKSKIDLAESCKIAYEKAGSHLSDYFLFYVLSSIGLVLGIFYFVYQYTHHQFAFWEDIRPFNLDISLFQIVNYFWVTLVVLALVSSSYLYCAGRVALRKKNALENEFRKKTEEYEKIFNNVPVSIMILDKNGTVISLNPYFTTLSEQSARERIGKNIFDFTFIKKSEELQIKYKNLLYKGESFSYYNLPSYISLKDDLKVKYLNIWAVPIKNDKGESEGAISIAQDNSETHHALEELKSRARQIYLINQISRAINSVLNLEEVLWLILRNAVKLTNAVSGAILLLENEDDLVVKEAYNMPPGWQNVRVKVGQGLCGHAAFIKQLYFSNDVKNDPYFIGQPEIENIKSEMATPIILDKKVIGVIKVDSDEVGRFKEGEVESMTTLANNAAIAIANSQLYEEVKDLNKNLEEKVKQRTEELKIANQKLEKSIELKSQFIADASHELRTPLTIVKGNLDIALLDEKVKAKELKETLKSIDEEVEHMSGILADLMVLTHAGSGKLNIKRTTANLDNLLKTAAQSMEILAKEKNIKIEVNANGGVNVLIDENKFLKLLLNLISNAIKYGKNNGWVRLSTENSNDEIRIIIGDNGIGIPEDELPFIFERFYRVNKVRTREKIGGSGLGLAICKSIAEAHGGYIDVQSKVGEGSQFVIHLPNKKLEFVDG